MNPQYIQCPKCRRPLDVETYNAAEPFVSCAGCGARLHVHAFPVFFKGVRQSAESLAAKLDDATCFFHAGKKAATICDECGRFLCGLCELPFGDETLCSSCLEACRKTSDAPKHKARRVCFDKLALGLAVVPLVLYFPGVVLTAPAALLIALIYWRKKPDFSPGFRGRMIAAVLFSVMEIIGAVAGIRVLIGAIANG